MNNNKQSLGKIIIENEKYYYCSNDNFSDENNLQEMMNFSWLLYQGNNYPKTHNKYILSEGDYIKLGKIILKIKEINLNNSNDNNNDNNNNNNNLSSLNSEEEKMSNNYHNEINNDINNSNIIEKKYKENNVIHFKNLYSNSSLNKISQKETLTINKETINREINESFENIFENNNETERKKNYKFNIKLTKIILRKKSKKKTKIKKCRICYSQEEDSKNNPLIKPCLCSGSLKYIHYKCLLHWLSNKISIKKFFFSNENFFSIYSINKINCELCKEKYPEYIKHNNIIYSLINLEKYNNNNFNYIIFDAFPIDKINYRFRYIINFNNVKNVILGRGKDANIILNDISISRIHCQFILNDKGNILVNDLNSKFGTLILIQNKKIEILKGQNLFIQYGRTFLNFEIKKKFSFFNCCDLEIINTNINYEKLNRNKIKYNKYKELKEEIINLNNESEDFDSEEDEKIKAKNFDFYDNLNDNFNNDLSIINQGEITNVSSNNLRCNKNTIESENYGTLSINRPKLNYISENKNEESD